jgi:hypothetical protein
MFSRQLEKKGFQRKKRNAGVYWAGISPKSAWHRATEESEDDE